VKEIAMKRFVFAFAIMAVAFFTSAARADYALVRFEDGWCRIWWDSAGTPWGVGWTKVAVGMPDWLTASAALSSARAQGVCR
jgi:hypothetical protein